MKGGSVFPDFVDSVIQHAWEALPPTHRRLLEQVGCARWLVTSESIGQTVDELLVSSGHPDLSSGQRRELDQCLGAWVPELRLLVINSQHPAHEGLDSPSYEQAIAKIAWHEWGHALSIHRTNEEDIEAGQRLLSLAPPGIAATIRSGSYRARELTHEVLAEIYSVLLGRLQRGVGGQPPWLDDEIWEMHTRVMEWTP
jgi:hypothetical protein